MTTITTETILKLIREIKDPLLQRDLVSLNYLQDVQVKGANVSIDIVIPTPSPRSKQFYENEIKKTIFNSADIADVQVNVRTEVPQGKGSSGKQAVPGVKNIIAVSSGKGGVGKSTVAVNLAVTLAQWGASVGLLDTDVYGPNVPIMLGVDREPLVEGKKLVPIEAYSVKVMSVGFLNRGDKPVVWRGPMLHTAVRQFLYDVIWGDLDYLVVDMPPGTGDAQLSLAQLVPVQGAILVTTPQEVAMADVRKALNMFEQVHIPIFGIVENMSYFSCDHCSKKHFIFGSGGGEELARRFKTTLLGQIPLSTIVREGGDAGLPIVVSSPDSEQASSFREIAHNVLNQATLASLQDVSLPVINLGDSRGDSFAV
jgi:ATP-binding protein involved in chromosome partitioning